MTWQDRLEVAAHRGLAALPTELCSDIGAWLGRKAARRRYPAQDRRTRALFRELRPDLAADPAALEAALDRCWANAGRAYAEFSVLPRMFREGRHGWQGEAEARYILDDLRRPTIALFTHTGNWEMSGFGIAHLVPNRSASVADVPKKPHRAAIVGRVRAAAPWRNFPMGRSVWRDVLGLLRQPGGTFLAASDDLVAGRLAAPLFGRPVRTDGNLGKIARLALKTRAHVVLVYNERLPGVRFVTHVLPPLDLQGDARDDGAVEAALGRFDAAITPHILRLADQWHMAVEIGDVTLAELAARHSAGGPGGHDPAAVAPEAGS